MQSVAGASVANLVLDCIAVFGFGMGIKGAALSTTVAQWVGLVYLVKEVREQYLAVDAFRVACCFFFLFSAAGSFLFARLMCLRAYT